MGCSAVLKKIESCSFPEVGEGHAKNVREFFEKTIRFQFENTVAIKKQHQALMEYIYSEGAIFFIRAHGSYSQGSYESLRRGFLSKYSNDVGYVFCDNTFAKIFVMAKLAGVETITSDFYANFLKQRDVACGHAETSEERELAWYRCDKNKLTKLRGWYLAHLLPVGSAYQDYDFGKKRNALFPKGEREEWNNAEKVRQLDTIPSEDEMKLLRAFFVRFIHPLNNFIVPNIRRLKYDFGNTIGEEAELLSFVSQYIRESFPREYNEMVEVALGADIPSPFLSPISHIEWWNVPRKMMQPQRSIESDKLETISKQEISSLIKRMGATAFIYYYGPIRDNADISAGELASYCPSGSKWTWKSKLTRASIAKRIVRQGLAVDVFEIIRAGRLRMDPNLMKIVDRYYDTLINVSNTAREEE